MTVAELPHSLDLEGMLALPALLRRRAAEKPHAVFLRQVDGDDLDYAGLERRVRGWMRALAAAGVRPGDRVATLLPPSFDAVAVWMAAARLAAVETPLNTALRGSLLSYVLGDAEPRCVVAAPGLVGPLRELASRGKQVPPVLLAAGVPVQAPPSGEGFDLRAPDFNADEPAIDHDPRPYEAATIVYTSGTSGRSKGVVVPWAQQYATARWLMPLDGRVGDVWYGPWAMFHVSGKVGLYSSALLDGQLVLRDGFSASSFWDDVRRFGVTSTMIVASTVAYLTNRPADPSDRDHTLRNVCAAPLPEDTDSFEQRFGVRLSTLYNMTEVASPIVTGWSDAPTGSCGRAREGVEARVVDENGDDVADGEAGELVLRMTVPHEIMTGYWRAPEATVEAWRDLWFHTGDAVRRDADGWFYFLDRLKDTIRRGGENISSVELEALVNEHPLVRESAAVGVPNAHGDRDVKLFVVGEPGLDVAELATDLDDRLPRYMRPACIALLPSLPKTHTARIRKAQLRDLDDAPDWVRPRRTPRTMPHDPQRPPAEEMTT
ncbi:AMP-binding protein [Nonomuraea sp. NPDC048892]|uniref:AMP-binding protein n=1 Tax=Nonomuraea sp. NPDC048892 TaxID=3154624 RepID=UPI00340261F9